MHPAPGEVLVSHSLALYFCLIWFLKAPLSVRHTGRSASDDSAPLRTGLGRLSPRRADIESVSGELKLALWNCLLNAALKRRSTYISLRMDAAINGPPSTGCQIRIVA